MALVGTKKRGGRSYQRILELKSMVDKIINQCNIESKEVKQGLQMIKDYQLDVLDQIRDLPEEEEEKTNYGGNDYYSRTQSREVEPYGYTEHRPTQTIVSKRPQPSGERWNDPRVVENYEKLESDYNELRRQWQKLQKQQRYDDSSNEGESIIHRIPREEPPRPTKVSEDYRRPRPTEEVTRPRYDAPQRKAQAYVEEPPRYKSKPGTVTNFGNNYQSQISSLKQQLAEAYKKIDKLTTLNAELQRKLRAAEQEIAYLSRDQGTSKRYAGGSEQSNLRREVQRLQAELKRTRERGGQSALISQLEQLKRQNQELRVQTIRLLKLKGGDNRQLQQQIINLHATIEKEDKAKLLFLQDIENFKRKHAEVLEQNKQLKARLQNETSTYSPAFPNTEYISYANYNSPTQPAESNLERYRSVLNGFKTNPSRYL